MDERYYTLKKNFKLIIIAEFLNFGAFFAYLTRFKGVSNYLYFLNLLELAGSILLLVALTKMRKVNRYIRESWIFAIAAMVITVIVFVFRSINTSIFPTLAQGLDISLDFIELAMVIYLLRGIRRWFKYEHVKEGRKPLKVCFFIYEGLYLLYFIGDFLMTFDDILKNSTLSFIINFAHYIFLMLTYVLCITFAFICNYYIRKATPNDVQTNEEEVEQNGQEK